MIKRTGFRDEAGTEAVAELKPDEYKGARAAVVSTASEGAVKRKATPKTPAEPTPQEKKLKSCNGARAAALRKLKSHVDKGDALVSAARTDAGKLPCKGYPEAMKAYMAKKIESVDAEVKDAKSLYAAEAVAALEKSPDRAATLARLWRARRYS